MNVRYLKFSRKLGAISGETCNLAQNSKGSQTISETIHISDNFTQRFDVFTIFLVEIQKHQERERLSEKQS